MKYEKKDEANILNTPNIMKDCLKIHFERGLQGGFDENSTSYYIVTELIRLGYSQEQIVAEMDNWYKKMGKTLPPNRFKERVISVIDWAFRNLRELGCSEKGSLKMFGYCLKKNDPEYTCEYKERMIKIRKVLSNPKHFNESAFHEYGWPEFLLKVKKGAGFYAAEVYKLIRRTETLRGLIPGDIIFLGFAEMRRSFMTQCRDLRPSQMTMFRAIKILEEFGLIKCVVKGKRGIARRQANGYRRILPIPKPPEGWNDR